MLSKGIRITLSRGQIQEAPGNVLEVSKGPREMAVVPLSLLRSHVPDSSTAEVLKKRGR